MRLSAATRALPTVYPNRVIFNRFSLFKWVFLLKHAPVRVDACCARTLPSYARD